MVEKFTYSRATVISNISLDLELNKTIGKAVAAMAKLSKRVWENIMLNEASKI